LAANLTDEQILGIEMDNTGVPATEDSILPTENELLSAGTPGARGDRGQDARATTTRLPDAELPADLPVEMPGWMQALAGDPARAAEARQFWAEHRALRSETETLRADAEALRQNAETVRREAETLRQNEQSLREASASVDRIDAAIFSGDARAQSEVVAEIARANPAAFRSLFAEAAKVLAGMGAGRREQEARITNHEARVTNDGSRIASQQSPVTGHPSSPFDPAAYASFERNTNDAVGRDVRGTISETLTRVLPEGVADGAARRIGEDIFNEVHRAMAADRSLSEQVGEVLRERRFGNTEQQRVAALLAARARQLVPSVARRVIGEWTSSVLGTARTKAARQAAAASRVDIAAAGGSMDSMPLRAMSSREVNYASMSDDEILGM
jgi:hypothetical protein